MSDQKLNIVFAAFLVVFITISYLAITNKRLPVFTRAANTDVDINKSMIIANKLEAMANGTDFSTLTVFVRNSEGITLENKSVTMSSSLGYLDRQNSVTDKYGQAIFTIKSSDAGSANVTASIEGTPLSTGLVIKFSNSD